MKFSEAGLYRLSGITILEEPTDCNGDNGYALLTFKMTMDKKTHQEVIPICKCWNGCNSTFPLEKLEIGFSTYGEFIYWEQIRMLNN